MTTTERNLTCEERVSSHLDSRVAQLAEMYEAIDQAAEADNDDDYDYALQELDEFPLAVEIRHRMVVQISTGGPGDQFEIDVMRTERGGWELADNEATYRFLDWFDGATRTTDDENVMRWLENFCEILYEG